MKLPLNSKLVTFLHSDVSIIVFKWHFKPCHSCGQQKQPSNDHSPSFSQLSLSLSTESVQLSRTDLVWGRGKRTKMLRWNVVDQYCWSTNWSLRSILRSSDRSRGGELGRHFSGVFLICAAVVVENMRWCGESKVSWNICVIKTPSCGSLGDLGDWMVVVMLVQLSGVVSEEIWWWWCPTPTPPPPQTALSSSLHSSVDIMYNALTPVSYNSVLHTLYDTLYALYTEEKPFFLSGSYSAVCCV